MRRARETILAVEKQIITYSDSVFVALGIQHTMHMRHVIIRGLSGFKLFSTSPH
jgi:hypothetical protein